MDVGLKNRVCVVTGGSSGIGLAVAQAFLREGAQVAICGRSRKRLDEAVKQLAAGEERLLSIACDVTDETQVSNLRSDVERSFGRCDVLVCNAGQARRSSYRTTSDADWHDEFDLKFFSVLYPVRAFLQMLEASGQGSIVCTGALIARRPEPFLIATSAMRAGQLNLCKSLALEFAEKGVRVNSVLIGLVDSGQWGRRYSGEAPEGVSKDDWLNGLARERGIPLGRLGRPDEAANAIVFFASPQSSYVTGETIEVAGGQSRHV